MYSVATHTRSSSQPLPNSRTMWAPRIRSSAPTSRSKRLRKSGSSAYSGRITFTAAGPVAPVASRPRYTRPIPPLPSTDSNRYGPACRGSLFRSGTTGGGSIPAAA